MPYISFNKKEIFNYFPVKFNDKRDYFNLNESILKIRNNENNHNTLEK
jgi:hypothetical protein